MCTEQNVLEVLLNIELALSDLQNLHMFLLVGLDLIPCGMDIHINLYS